MRVLRVFDLHFKASDGCETASDALRELADYMEDDSKPYMTPPRKATWEGFCDTVDDGGRVLGGMSLDDNGSGDWVRVWPKEGEVPQ